MVITNKVREAWLEYNAERQYQMNKMWGDKNLSLDQKHQLSNKFAQAKYGDIKEFAADYEIYAEMEGIKIGNKMKDFARKQAKYTTHMYDQKQVNVMKEIYEEMGVDVSRSEIRYGSVDINKMKDNEFKRDFFSKVTDRYNKANTNVVAAEWIAQNIFGS